MARTDGIKSPIYTARKRLDLTQIEFGERVFKRLGRKNLSKFAIQKKVSLWESRNLKPTANELRAMAEVLEIPESELAESAGPLAHYLPAELRSVDANTLIVLSCCAPPDMLFDPEGVMVLGEAVRAGASLAILVPFTVGYPLERDESVGLHLRTEAHHLRVWGEALALYHDLRDYLEPEHAEKLAVFGPEYIHYYLAYTPAHTVLAVYRGNADFFGRKGGQYCDTHIYLLQVRGNSRYFDDYNSVEYNEARINFTSRFFPVARVWEPVKKLPAADYGSWQKVEADSLLRLVSDYPDLCRRVP